MNRYKSPVGKLGENLVKSNSINCDIQAMSEVKILSSIK